MREVLVLLSAVLAGGCDLAYEPDVGALLPVAATALEDGGSEESPDGGDGGMMTEVSGPCADSDPDVEVSFAEDVRPLTYKATGGCTCHATSSTSGFNLGSYERLRRGGLNSGVNIIVPGKPCDSIIVQKLGLAPPFGSRMPYNGPPYFTAEELQVVKDWIAEGALNN